MRCAIISRAGQTLAKGTLKLQPTNTGEFRLLLETDRGRQVEGGLVGEDGDLTAASQVLFQGLFGAWGMSDLRLMLIQDLSGGRRSRRIKPASKEFDPPKKFHY